MRELRRYYYMFFSLFLTITMSPITGTYGQQEKLPKMHVIKNSAEFLPNTIIRDKKVNYDANMNLAAGLLIISDLNGLAFESNLDIIKMKKKGAGAYLLLKEISVPFEIYL